MLSRTLFYGLPLQGVGTGDVESLRSYVERLALEHNLRPQILLNILFKEFPLEAEKGFDYSVIHVKREIHGLTKTGAVIIERLQLATGANLAASTMGRFQHLFPNMRLTKNGSSRYCAQCARENGGLSHGRLAWELQCVVACPKHGIRLLPSKTCGAPTVERLPVSRRPALSSVCSLCGSIGHRCVPGAAEPASAVELWVAQQVGGVLALKDSEVAAMSDQTVQKGIQALVHGAFDGSVVAASLQSGMNKGAVSTWYRGVARPLFASLVQLCLHSGASVTEALGGRFVKTARAIQTSERRRLLERGYRRNRVPDDELRAQLLTALEDPTPPSVADLSRRLATEKMMLYRREPDLVKALARRHTAHLEELFRQQYETELETFAAAVERLRNAGRRVTAKYVAVESGLCVFRGNKRRRRALQQVMAGAASDVASDAVAES